MRSTPRDRSWPTLPSTRPGRRARRSVARPSSGSPGTSSRRASGNAAESAARSGSASCARLRPAGSGYRPERSSVNMIFTDLSHRREWFSANRGKRARMKGRRIDARVALEFLRATEAAAIVSGKLVGRGDKNQIDQAAVDAMRSVLGEVDIDGLVVIGEGEKDEAPMLYIGEHVGTGDGPAMDVAVDPIDGTTLASKGGHGAISVVAAAERGSLFHTHVAYMDKIIVGRACRGVISIEVSVEDNVRSVAKAMGRPVTEITVEVLERDRSTEKVRRLREFGARVRLFGDGDVANGIIAALEERSRIDMLMGIGGATEGVVTALAVKGLGGGTGGRH